MFKYSFRKNYKFYITVFLAMVCFITTLTSVGFGALNQNLNIAGDVEYEKDTDKVIMSWNTSSYQDFHSYTYRKKIKTVDFLDNKRMPANVVASWDVSANNDGGVLAWIINDPDNEGYFKLYIGANGGVLANVNSGYVFYDMEQSEKNVIIPAL